MKNNNGREIPAQARRLFCVVLSAFLFLFAATVAPAAMADAAHDKIFAQRAEAAFDEAQSQYESQTNNPVLAWQFARTCYDWADWATNKTQRAAIARLGMDACRHSLLLTDSAAAHYYLAMDMGQLAQAETFSALGLVRQMAGQFDAAAQLDIHFDYAGPERGLGLLHRDAPVWPLSIGNRRKAREFLESAVTLSPGYPENVLNLAESCLAWGDRTEAKKELAALAALWPAAQTNFTGQAWEQSWDDWTHRRDDLRKELNKP